MTKQIDTYNHMIGSGAILYPWWAIERDSSPESLSVPDNAYDGWEVILWEVDPETGETVSGPHTVNHAVSMRAANSIARDNQWNTSLRAECWNLIRDDDADFDQPSADVVLQVALFGDTKYS